MTLESRDQWDADVVSIALRTGGTIPADLFVREMKRAIAAEREACAQIVEREAECYGEPVWAIEILSDIRARGQA